MITALINTQTGTVDNLVMADPETDAAPAGYMLVAVPDDVGVGVGWLYTPEDGFVVPMTADVVQQGFAF